MSDYLKRLVAEQNRTFTRMQEIQGAAESEDRDWTAEERENWDKADERLNVLASDIERVERQAQRDMPDFGSVVRAGSAPGDGETPEARAEAANKEYEDAFRSFVRHGADRLTSEQRALMATRASTDPQVTSTGSVGGYLIPPGYRALITEALKAYGGVYNFANVITTATGNSLQWPNHDGTSQKGRILATENTAVTTNQLTFGTKSIGAYTYSSDQVLVSLALLQDSAFDLDSYVPNALGERLGRILADHLVSGNGTSQPEGIITNATSGVTAASASLTYDNLIDLEHSVDPAYRNGGRCRFIFNDGTLSVIRKLKDTQNRPLWLPVPVPGMPATINGLPYTIDQSMPAVGTGNKSIAFGDFHRGLLVRQVLDIHFARLAERYAEYLQVGFFGFLRLDAKQDDALAYRVLTHA